MVVYRAFNTEIAEHKMRGGLLLHKFPAVSPEEALIYIAGEFMSAAAGKQLLTPRRKIFRMLGARDLTSLTTCDVFKL